MNRESLPRRDVHVPSPIGEQLQQLINSVPVPGLYRIELTARDDLALPAFSGSAFRGLFGHGLKRTVCITRMAACEDCILVASCAYPLVFETPAAAVGETDARYSRAPHPFVLSVEWDSPRIVPKGEKFHLGINLFGRANSLLPYIVHAIQRMGEKGLGRGSGRFELSAACQTNSVTGVSCEVYSADGGRVETVEPRRTPPTEPPHRVWLETLTPLRIKRNGRLVGPDALDARQLLTVLCRRAELLARHFGTAVPPISNTALADLAAATEWRSAGLRWIDWTRYSSRQGTTMQMGGLMGRVLLGGSGLAALWPLLELGQWLHLGKGTSMGLGRYRLSAAASLPERTATPAA